MNEFRKPLAGVASALALVGLIAFGVAAVTGVASAASAKKKPKPITGKILGRFHRDCLLCDGERTARILASNAWCAWQDGKVIIHVTFRNTSIEHLTVQWHPSYHIREGSDHGTGLTSVQDAGIDGKATREVIAEQDPKGTPDGSRIDECKPSFFGVDSG